MTDLNRRVRRVTSTTVRYRGKPKRLVVTLYPGDIIGVRPEKTRQEETTTLAAVYGLAIKQRVAKEQAEKKAARKARRG
jgi:hypothetical protein